MVDARAKTRKSKEQKKTEQPARKKKKRIGALAKSAKTGRAASKNGCRCVPNVGLFVLEAIG
jgi:hypothetical protein